MKLSDFGQYSWCNCEQSPNPDPFANMDPKVKKMAGLLIIISNILKSDYASLKAWQDMYKEEWAIDEYVYIITKKLMEMSEDDFNQFQAKYNEEVRQYGKDGDKSSDSDGKKGSGEIDANLLREGSGSGACNN